MSYIVLEINRFGLQIDGEHLVLVPSETGRVSDSKTHILIYLILISVLTFAVYSQVFKCGYISLDDAVYVIENDNIKSGFTLESIRWAFLTTNDGNWFPLTWLSYILDNTISSSAPSTYHTTNLLYHVINSSLLFVALHKLTGHINRSAFVAALFALHPLHVESVAWISERKDLLSTFFFFLTVIVYVEYQERKGLYRYLVALALFICGLMSKSMLVSTPLLLILLDYWPLRRTESFCSGTFGKLLVEKVPFAIFSAISCVITYNVQKHKAVVSFDESPLLTNISNAAVSYVMYICKTFVPVRLSVIYPFQADISSIKVAVAMILLVAFSAGVIILRKAKPYLLVGWFWYLISLLPVIGIVRVGKQSMADRYTYIPLVGFFIFLVWGISEFPAVGRIGMKLRIAVTAILFSVLSLITWNQVQHWKSSISLFSHAIDVTEDNWVALGVLGYDYFKLNDLDAALTLLNKSLAINPKNVMALYNMGVVQNKLGNREQALQHFQKIVAIEPDYRMAHYQIGLQLLSKGDTAGALHEHNILEELDPDLSRQLLSSIRIQSNSSPASGR